MAKAKTEDLSLYSEFTKRGTQLLRPYIKGEDMKGIDIPKGVKPEEGGVVAIDKDNIKDKWYITPELAERSYKSVELSIISEPTNTGKVLDTCEANGASKAISDLKIIGNGDTFQLLCKASSASKGMMKSTKAMQINGVGCVIQVSTFENGQVAEALQFVPGVKIAPGINGGRKIIKI